MKFTNGAAEKTKLPRLNRLSLANIYMGCFNSKLVTRESGIKTIDTAALAMKNGSVLIHVWPLGLAQQTLQNGLCKRSTLCFSCRCTEFTTLGFGCCLGGH